MIKAPKINTENDTQPKSKTDFVTLVYELSVKRQQIHVLATQQLFKHFLRSTPVLVPPAAGLRIATSHALLC